METIRVYHSLWKNCLLIAGSFLFAAGGIFILIEYPTSSRIMAWLCILFFGIGGLFMLWVMLKERITRNPYLTITDECIIINNRLKWKINFSDVKRFFLMGTKPAMMGIQYKKGVEFQKQENASKVGRKVRRFNEHVLGSQESILVDNLTISPKVLCEILNERVKLSKKI